MYLPTAITPSGRNNINDQFGAFGNIFAVSEYSLYIYNRYGELVFSTTDPNEKWDGIYKNKEFGNVNFVRYSKYIIRGKQRKTQRGNLLVIR